MVGAYREIEKVSIKLSNFVTPTPFLKKNLIILFCLKIDVFSILHLNACYKQFSTRKVISYVLVWVLTERDSYSLRN